MSTNTNTVGYYVEGALTFRKSIEVSDERTVELVRRLDAVFESFSAPPRGRKKAGVATSDAEPDTKIAAAMSPDETA